MQLQEYTVTVSESNEEKWYQCNQLHRIGGPAIIYANGDKHWYQYDSLHRVDGPAVESADGTKYWYQSNRLHRIDGPAIECPDGDKRWYIEGKELTEQEFNAQQNSCADNAEIIVNGKKYRLVEE